MMDDKKRLLFVDDEPAILTSLQAALHRERGRWDMAFALGGERALAELREKPFDVVIADMRMPGLDGAALLGIVQAEFPTAVRILLSGRADRDSIVRALPSMHQFLSKPCELKTLRAAIDRCLAVVSQPRDAQIRALIGRLDKLPSPPNTYFELARLAASPTSTLADVAAVVARDPAMAAKVLQLANSAAFGLPRTLTTIQQAVSYLGMELIKVIALTTTMFVSGNATIEQLQATSLEVAAVARRLVADRQRAETVFVAGLLHHVGRAVLVVSCPEVLAAAAAEAARTGEEVATVEQRMLGASEAEIGACLLGVWGLPSAIVEVVALHRTPTHVGDDLAELVAAVHVARAVVAREHDTIDRAFLSAHMIDADAWLARAAAR
jgi:HD-like signal output (HDOD) protein/ActR/RegA family two-component response regulator